jgi:hypothetical protein
MRALLPAFSILLLILWLAGKGVSYMILLLLIALVAVLSKITARLALAR